MEQTTIFDALAAVDTPTPFQRALAGSTRASRKWTDAEVDAVDSAIRRCAAELDTFTADDVWKRLPEGFPVTKGLTARLSRAANDGLIFATDRVRRTSRGGMHDHGQRLTVWESLR